MELKKNRKNREKIAGADRAGTSSSWGGRPSAVGETHALTHMHGYHQARIFEIISSHCSLSAGRSSHTHTQTTLPNTHTNTRTTPFLRPFSADSCPAAHPSPVSPPKTKLSTLRVNVPSHITHTLISASPHTSPCPINPAHQMLLCDTAPGCSRPNTLSSQLCLTSTHAFSGESRAV